MVWFLNDRVCQVTVALVKGQHTAVRERYLRDGSRRVAGKLLAQAFFSMLERDSTRACRYIA